MNEQYKSLYINKKDNFFSALIIFIIAVMCVFVFTVSTVSFVVIDGESMYPTFNDQDVVVQNTISPVRRGDVVIIKNKKTNSDLIIKRIIAVGGDQFYFEGGNVYLKKKGEADFNLLKEDYVVPNTTFYPNVTSALDIKKSAIFTIEDGEYYFLGDNRTDSHDSRSGDFGTCNRQDIVGVVSSFAIKTKEVTKSLVIFTNKVYSSLGLI